MPSPPNNIDVVRWSLKERLKTWQQALHWLKTFITVFIIIRPHVGIHTLLSWKIPSKTKCISDNVLNWHLCLFKNKSLLVTVHEKRNCLFIRMNFVQMKRWRGMRTLIVAPGERLKSFLAHAKCTRTHCICAIHVPIRITVLYWYCHTEDKLWRRYLLSINSHVSAT